MKTADTIANKALEADVPLAFRLQDLRYTITPGFDVAEGGLYGATELICQPLVREGTVRLIAAYPAKAREAVETPLDGLRSRLARIVADRSDSAKRPRTISGAKKVSSFSSPTA